MMTFEKWLDTYVDEKGLDIHHWFEVNGHSGVNFIPLGSVIDVINSFPPETQAAAKNHIVADDFSNRDPLKFFEYIAQKMAS